MACNLNLLVTMAACYGAHLVNVIDPERHAPFWGMIGPTEMVLPSEISLGFQSFYTTLASTLRLDRALEALKSTVYLPDAWLLYTAELILAMGYGRYLDKHQGPGGLKEQEKTALRRLKKRFGSLWTRPKGLRRVLRRQLTDHEDSFKRFRERFLMLDLYSDNGERFPLTAAEARALWDDVQQRGTPRWP